MCALKEILNSFLESNESHETWIFCPELLQKRRQMEADFYYQISVKVWNDDISFFDIKYLILAVTMGVGIILFH